MPLICGEMRLLQAGCLLLAIGMSGCDSGPYDQSVDAKRPYSVLQSREYDLRNFSGRYRYVYTRRALGTEYDTVALPTGRPRYPYVVIIANAPTLDHVLAVPGNERPIVTPTTLKELVSRGYLSAASEQYLAARVDR